MIIIAVLSDERIKSLGVHIMKARHCSHCFQYYLASRVLAFFFDLSFSIYPREVLVFVMRTPVGTTSALR